MYRSLSSLFSLSVFSGFPTSLSLRPLNTVLPTQSLSSCSSSPFRCVHLLFFFSQFLFSQCLSSRSTIYATQSVFFFTFLYSLLTLSHRLFLKHFAQLAVHSPTLKRYIYFLDCLTQLPPSCSLFLLTPFFLSHSPAD